MLILVQPVLWHIAADQSFFQKEISIPLRKTRQYELYLDFVCFSGFLYILQPVKPGM